MLTRALRYEVRRTDTGNVPLAVAESTDQSRRSQAYVH